MFFLWKSNQIGKIWINGAHIKNIVSENIQAEFYCKEVSFIGECSTFMVYIALPEDVSLDKKMACEEKISKILAGLGANLQINWVRVLPQDNPKTTPIWTTPIFWAGFFASLTVLIRLGIVGVLYTLLSAIIGYCVSWFFLTEDGEKQILEIMKKFGR